MRHGPGHAPIRPRAGVRAPGGGHRRRRRGAATRRGDRPAHRNRLWPRRRCIQCGGGAADLRAQGPPRRPSGDRAHRRCVRAAALGARRARGRARAGRRVLARSAHPDPAAPVVGARCGHRRAGHGRPALPGASDGVAAVARFRWRIGRAFGQSLRARVANQRGARARGIRRRGAHRARWRRLRGRHREHDRRVHRRAAAHPAPGTDHPHGTGSGGRPRGSRRGQRQSTRLGHAGSALCAAHAHAIARPGCARGGT